MTFSLAVALVSPAGFLPTALMSPLSSSFSVSIVNVEVTSPFDGLVSIFVLSSGSSFVSPLNLYDTNSSNVLYQRLVFHNFVIDVNGSLTVVTGRSPSTKLLYVGPG